MKVTGLQQFKVDLHRFAKDDVPKKVLDVQRSIGLAILSGLIMRSPVDTGRFRASWTAQAGSPNPRFAADGLESYPAPSASALMASSGLRQPFGKLYLSNNLPYAEPLENGHSRQAPAGVVAVTVATFNGVGR